MTRPRDVPLRAEPLEARDVPAGQPFELGNILVDAGTYGAGGFVREYTPDGTFVQQVDIPNTDWAYARGLAVAANGYLAVFNGTFSPRLSVYNPIDQSWTDYTYPGWSIVNVLYNGSVTTRGNYAFATDDMTYSGGEAQGIVRFDVRDGSAQRFVPEKDYVRVHVGPDGLLYAMAGLTVDVYDPDTFDLVRNVSLDNVPHDWLYSITVNEAGEVYVARGPYIYRVAPDGTVLGMGDLTVITGSSEDAWSLDTSPDGSRIMAVGGSGRTTVMNLDFSDPVVFLTTGGYAFGTFVNTPPVVPSISIADTSALEGNVGIKPRMFAVTLSEPTTTTVSVHYSTQDGTATAGEDYTAVDGTLVFAPGETAKSVRVNIIGDRKTEPDETFTLVLSEPFHGVLGDDSAMGVILNDDPPLVANAGPDWSGGEGRVFQFTAAGTSGPSGVSRTYLWDFGDNSTAGGLTPYHRYQDNGTYTVTLTVRDASGNLSTDTATATVTNQPPRGSVTGPLFAVPGWARPYHFTGTDPGLADRASLEYRFDWGDGQSATLTGGTAATSAHAYAAPGTYTVGLRVADKDGGISPEYRWRVVVRPVVVLADTVYAAGTAGDDDIEIRSVSAFGTRMTIRLNGQPLGTWSPSGVIIFAGEGNDTVKTVGPIRPRVLVYGGPGNDTIDVGSAIGPSVLVGGDGDDILRGGAGRDVLIGGHGADTLDGRGDADIMIGGSVTFEGDPFGLRQVSAEWSRPLLPYESRRDHLLGSLPGGLNGPNLLAAATVADDSATDTLTGGSGRDWYFDSIAHPDVLTDLAVDETVTPF